MTISAKSCFFGGMAMLLSAGSVLAQEACQTYVVVPGDNLRFIARAAYGDGDMYRVIYNANIDAIGQKADLITVGTTLAIPCDPRQETAAAPVVGLTTEVVDPAKETVAIVPELTVDAGNTVVEVAAATPAPTPAPSAETPVPEAAPVAFPVRMVTGNGYAPFADEMLPGGGMFTQLVEMAIFRADPAIPYNMTFVNDWQAHVDALLPSGAYDISFPWVRPDCESPETLSASDAARCEAFVFSSPLYEIVDGFFMPVGSELLAATSYASFEGKRICRPEGYTTGVLEAVGLPATKIDLTRPVSVKDCFESLAAGKVDIVSIDAEVGDSAIADLEMIGDFAQNPHLVTFDSLHVIAHKSNARAVEMVGKLNEGVLEMYETGEWYDIVSTALARKSNVLQQ